MLLVLPGLGGVAQAAPIAASAPAPAPVTATADVSSVIPKEGPAELEAIIQDFVAKRQFMGSVLVARDGDVLLSKGYGSANLEWQIPNSPATKFRLGSVTKQFTAACILLLEERGALSLQDPVKKHLPDAPAAWDKVTIFHLLTHTSGIPSYTNLPDFGAINALETTPEKLVARFRNLPLEFQPGEKWAYSNSGYALLGYLIEKISGQSYATFTRNQLFEPLGMKDTGCDSNAAILPLRAAGYIPTADGPRNAPFAHMSIPFSAGALYSTTGDLLRWERGLSSGKLLKAESLQKMITPFKNDYALGLVVHTVNGRKLIEHGGGIEGFNTHLAHYPEDRVTVVVLGNLNGGAPSDIAGKLGAALHGEKVVLASERKIVTVPLKVMEGYVGRFQLEPNFILAITLEDGKLFAQASGQGKFELFAESETNFFLKVVDAQVTFEGDAKGRASKLILHQGGGHMPAPRVD